MNQRDKNRNRIQYQYRNLLNIENKMTNTVVRIPEGIPSPKVSLFENMVNVIPVKTVPLWEFLLSSEYKDEVTRYRQTQDSETRKKIKMFRLPCVTVSGVFDTRSSKRLIERHNHHVCIDIDGKANPQVNGRWELVKQELADAFCCLSYAGLSIGGNGLCLVFRIAYSEKHKSQYCALVNELQMQFGLVADTSCCDIARLRVASYDPNPIFNPNAIPYFLLGLNGCQEPRRDKRSAHIDIKTRARVRACISQINTLRIDITSDYDAWRAIGQAFASEFGAREGRRLFHLVSMEYPDYYSSECDEMFNWCRSHHDSVGISTFFYYCLKHGITFK